MLKKIQEKSLATSNGELTDRSADGGKGNVDASAGIPPELRLSDQYYSCDVFRTPDDDRTLQLQSIRAVIHKVNLENTFSNADSSKESHLWVFTYDPKDGHSGVGAFTDRSYDGSTDYQINSASGEQMLPCGPAVEVIFTPEAGSGNSEQSGGKKSETVEKSDKPAHDNPEDRGSEPNPSPGTVNNKDPKKNEG